MNKYERAFNERHYFPKEPKASWDAYKSAWIEEFKSVSKQFSRWQWRALGVLYVTVKLVVLLVQSALFALGTAAFLCFYTGEPSSMGSIDWKEVIELLTTMWVLFSFLTMAMSLYLISSHWARATPAQRRIRNAMDHFEVWYWQHKAGVSITLDGKSSASEVSAT